MGKKPRGWKLWRAVHAALNPLGAVFANGQPIGPRETLAKYRTVSRWAGLELLEPRRLLSGGPYITGQQQAQADVPFALNLHANGSSFDHWSINWGDGTTSQSDVQSVTAAATQVQHTFSTYVANFTITAAAITISGGALSYSYLGGMDPTFGAGGVAQADLSGQNVQAFAIEPDNGAVYVLTDAGVERYGASGTRDSSFGADGIAALPSPANSWDSAQFSYIAVSNTGTIAVAGTDSQDFILGTYDSDGNLTNTYYQNEPTDQGYTDAGDWESDSFYVTDVEFDSSSMPFLSGYSSHFYEDYNAASWDFDTFAAILSPDGYSETQEGQADTYSNQITLADGEVLSPDSAYNTLALSNPDGSPDTTFGPDGSETTSPNMRGGPFVPIPVESAPVFLHFA